MQAHYVQGRKVIPSSYASIKTLQTSLLELLERLAYDEDEVFALNMGLTEALANAHLHGNGKDESKSIVITYELMPDTAIIEIRDEGSGFDPGQVPDPTEEENLWKNTGRGILLMKTLCDTVTFSQDGACVRMVKYIQSHQKQAAA